jgi:hypothetical protein
LAIIETLHIEAQNTYFFAYYSEFPRAFSSKFWNVQTHSLEEAKVLTLWFNSSFNIIQLLINRIPTGWFKIRGYVFDVLKVPDFKKIDRKTMDELLELFDELKDEAFPGIWVQFARNITKGDIPVSEWNLMKRTYENFENELGKGFQPRRRIDEVFLKFLPIKIQDSTSQFLKDLYVKMLNEVCLIKLAATEA